MIDEMKQFTLFDIPEDETVESNGSIVESDLETIIVEENKSACKITTLLQKLRSKFRRSTGKGGTADAMALRLVYDADFEGHVAVLRRTNKRNLRSLLVGKRNHAPKERFLLIEDTFCYVFKDELSLAPMYAIQLAYTETRVVPEGKDMLKAVVMKTRDGELEFEFMLSEHAKNFAAVANRMALQGEEDEIQNLLHQTGLIGYVESFEMETPTIPYLDG